MKLLTSYFNKFPKISATVVQPQTTPHHHHRHHHHQAQTHKHFKQVLGCYVPNVRTNIEHWHSSDTETTSYLLSGQIAQVHKSGVYVYVHICWVQ